MKIAVFYRKHSDNDKEFIVDALQFLKNKEVELIVHEKLTNKPYLEEIIQNCNVFSTHEELKQIPNIDFLFSFGGDGSFIAASKLVGNLNINMVGINTGRIGFLTTITKKNFEPQFQMLYKKKFTIEKRKLLHLNTDQDLPLENVCALNDITVRATEEDSVCGIEVCLNGIPVNTYWADGLIVATPTGSTAYSLSCGGSIIHPASCVNIITPIASHSLNTRPIIVNENDEIKIKVHSRGTDKFSLAIDNERIIAPTSTTLIIKKEEFEISMVRFHNTDFFSVIREKLLWGIDLRNTIKQRLFR
ncbi:MAG: NAD(+)/NADH kinase [Bacteroidales bacterium]|jgi:NAD+ kinase|nr:NAD(+)/NADH kinase [Bacteroidales bacterium]